jgi:glycosyltransferase involved in cell wall biosynthesis
VSSIRIAVVASTFGVGGAEMVTANVLRLLPRDRFEARLYFLQRAGDIGRELFAAGFGGAQRLSKTRRDPLALARLGACFRSFRPDVVFCLDHRDAMLLGRLAGIFSAARALVVASHSTGLVGRDGRARPSFGAGDRALMEFTARLVAVSATHADYLGRHAGIARSRIAVIENGIDLAAWPVASAERRRDARAALGIAADERVAAMVAGLRPEKSHETLLRAVARLNAAGLRLRVLLAGDGERRAALEKAAEALGVRGQIDFLGVRRDVARLLHASDVVVLPSRSVVETLPLAVLEAMATGVPVIASRVGSLPEVVVDRVTGLLIPPADAVELAGAIAYTLGEREPARERSARARERVVGRHAIERTAALYGALFEEVVAA